LASWAAGGSWTGKCRSGSRQSWAAGPLLERRLK
jgi:hypothetical protein